MTAVAVRTEPRRIPATAVMAMGCAVLMARPLLYDHAGGSVAAVVALFAGLFVAGALWPLPAVATKSMATLPAIVVGAAVFGTGRLLMDAPHVASVNMRFVILNTLAAVAEEAFFRRFAYGVLLEQGSVFYAIAGTALLFASVHIVIYGLWVLPVDLAAGAVLGWQRWATGSWTASAFTHTLANVLMVV